MATELRNDREFHRVTTIQEASDILRETEAVLISGGQSLMPLLRQGMIDRDVIVDISGIEEYTEIHIDDDLYLGGLATHRDLLESEVESTPWRALAETAKEIGDRQVRNWGTIGGSVAHADPSLDYPPVMTVMDANVEYSDGSSTETIPISEFYLGQYFTALEEHHIVTGVNVPQPPKRTGVAFEKFAWRRGDMSLVNVAARLTAEGNEITEAKLCVGAMGPVPIQLDALESELIGTDVDDAELQQEIADRVSEFTEPVPEAHASVDYKNRIAQNLTRKALLSASDRAMGEYS